MFTAAEYTALTGVTLSAAAFTLVHDLAVGLVESECGRTWPADPDPITKVRHVGDDGRVVLPRPVTSVDSVVWVDGDGDPTTVAATFSFDGLDTIHVLTAPIVLNATYADDSATVAVTWTPAAATVPAAVKAVALAVATRIQSNPSGAQDVAIDDYRQGWSGGGGVALLPSERASLARYGRKAIRAQRLVAT